MTDLYTWLDEGHTLVGDGAMGTELQKAGLDDGGAPELWNVEHPDRVIAILAAYADAGAKFLTTNSFGGSRPRLAMHGLEDRVHELIKQPQKSLGKLREIATFLSLGTSARQVNLWNQWVL